MNKTRRLPAIEAQSRVPDLLEPIRQLNEVFYLTRALDCPYAVPLLLPPRSLRLAASWRAGFLVSFSAVGERSAYGRAHGSESHESAAVHHDGGRRFHAGLLLSRSHCSKMWRSGTRDGALAQTS